MADRYLRMHSVTELCKLMMINFPGPVIGIGFYLMGGAFGYHAVYLNRHVKNDAFKRYKYKQVVVRPDSPFIQWFFQRDTEEELEEFKRDLVPYPNKWNNFKSLQYGIDITPKEVEQV